MVSSNSRALTLLDPTSLLGRELAERLAELLPEVRRSFFHTSGRDEHLISEVAGEASLVPPLSDVDELEGSAVVVATARPTALTTHRLLVWLREHPSVAFIDLSDKGGLSPGESAVAFDRLPRIGSFQWLRILDPSLVAAAFFLRGLAPLGPEELHVTTTSPASAFGEDAIEELASQGVARLSGRDPARPSALPSALAFDLAAMSGGLREELERQLAEVFPGTAVHLRAIAAGVFHGNLTTLAVKVRSAPTVERLRALLRGSPALRLARRNETVRSSDAVGSLQVACSDVAVADSWVLATLAADGLRLASVLLAAELIAALLTGRGEEEAEALQ